MLRRLLGGWPPEESVCVVSESLDCPMPLSELDPLSRVINSVEGQRLPVAVRGISPSLLRVRGDERTDGHCFVIEQSFIEDQFLEVFRQAHQDVFGMVAIVTLVEFVILRMRSAVYEDWTEGKTLLRRCIRQRSVPFRNLCSVVSDLTELRPSIRP